MVYLHGDLELKIIEARCLPNMDMLNERIRRFFTAFKVCRKAFKTPKRHINTSAKHYDNKNKNIITSDPYVTVCLSGARVARTRVIPNSQNPVWNENFNIPLAHPVSQVTPNFNVITQKRRRIPCF